MKRDRSKSAIFTVILMAGVSGALAQSDFADWSAYGGSNAATRFAPLKQITPENIDRLERAWVYRTGDMPAEGDPYAPETTPIKVGERLYLCTPMSHAIALDPTTGEELWRFDPSVSKEAFPYTAACRGVAYHRSAEASGQTCAERILYGTIDARLYALDAETGRPCAGFGNNGVVDLKANLGPEARVPGFVAVTSPPTIVRGVAVIGHLVLDGQKEMAPSGVVRGYDAVTGELAWAWDLADPAKSGPLPDDEHYTLGTPNMWTVTSADEQLGLVYLPMGNSAVDYFGGNRSPAEDANSSGMAAIDVTTGRKRWFFQALHRDVWDYDLSSQATLFDFDKEGETVPALVFATKQGEIFVLDRRTGEPSTEVEERPVPQGGAPGETLSPTQPFSVGMPSVAPKPITEKDTWGISPIDQLWCRIQFRRAQYRGRYTPPTVDDTWIMYPGNNGGVDWGGVAIDTDRDIMIVNWSELPMLNRLVPRDEADEKGMKTIVEGGAKDVDPQEGSPYALEAKFWRTQLGVPCSAPPWGGIMAVDLATRKELWRKPIGTARDQGPWGIPSMLPFTIGTPNNGGSVVTAGGLTFISAALDHYLRAYDTVSGKVLWKDRLPAGGQATPMSYQADGTQYVLIMAGGHAKMNTKLGDYVIAYALRRD